MHTYDIHGILSVASDEPILNDAFHDYFRVPSVGRPDLSIKQKSSPHSMLDLYNLDRIDNWFYGQEGQDVVYYKDRLLGQHDRVMVYGLEDETTTIAYHLANLPKTPGSRGSLSDLIEAVIDYKLLQRGYTTLHAASLCKDGRAVLLGGFPNVGKTLSTLALLQDGWAYMGDDNGVVGRDGTVYAYPSTSSIGYHDFLKYIEPAAIGRRRYYRHLARVWPMQYALVERLFDYPEVYLPDIGFEQGDTAEAAAVAVLQVGERDVTDVARDDMIAKLQASTDYSRPRLWQNPFIQAWAYFNDAHLPDLVDDEWNILYEFLSGVDCYAATCQHRDWGDVLREDVL